MPKPTDPKSKVPHTSPSAFTIAEFCRRNGISRAMYYKLQLAGKGPRVMAIGTHERISTESEADWKVARQQEAAAKRAAKSEQISASI
jgi:hypothetical protein